MMLENTDNYDLQVDMAKKLFLAYDQEALIRKFQLEADESGIYLHYLNTPCRIVKNTGAIEEYSGENWRECRDYGTVMTIYDLLCFPEGSQLPPLQQQWCTVGTFIVTGVTETEGFTKRYAKAFDGHLEQLKAACRALGGEMLPKMAGADLTCRIPVTSFFPVLLQFWEGDEEFPPKLLLLWDRNTHKFMHFETTFYLQGDLLHRLHSKLS